MGQSCTTGNSSTFVDSVNGNGAGFYWLRFAGATLESWEDIRVDGQTIAIEGVAAATHSLSAALPELSLGKIFATNSARCFIRKVAIRNRLSFNNAGNSFHLCIDFFLAAA